MSKSVKCSRDLRDFPPEAYRLPNDGRQWKHLCRDRRTLAMELATFANGDGSSITTGERRLTRNLGWGRAKVFRYIADLEELKVLTSEIRNTGTGRRTSMRSLHVDALPQVSSSQVPKSHLGAPQVSSSFPQVSSSAPQVSSSGTSRLPSLYTDKKTDKKQPTTTTAPNETENRGTENRGGGGEDLTTTIGHEEETDIAEEEDTPSREQEPSPKIFRSAPLPPWVYGIWDARWNERGRLYLSPNETRQFSELVEDDELKANLAWFLYVHQTAPPWRPDTRQPAQYFLADPSRWMDNLCVDKEIKNRLNPEYYWGLRGVDKYGEGFDCYPCDGPRPRNGKGEWDSTADRMARSFRAFVDSTVDFVK